MDETRIRILHYLMTGGYCCIHCGADASYLEWNSSDIDGQKVTCGKCGWSWYDLFDTVSVGCITNGQGRDVNVDDPNALPKPVGNFAEEAFYKEIGGKEKLPTLMGLSPAIDEHIESIIKEM